MHFEIEQFQQFHLKFIQNLNSDSSDVGVEAILVINVIEVFGWDYVGGQEETMYVSLVHDEERVVFLGAVDQDEWVDEDGDGAVHVFVHP